MTEPPDTKTRQSADKSRFHRQIEHSARGAEQIIPKQNTHSLTERENVLPETAPRSSRGRARITEGDTPLSPRVTRPSCQGEQSHADDGGKNHRPILFKKNYMGPTRPSALYNHPDYGLLYVRNRNALSWPWQSRLVHNLKQNRHGPHAPGVSVLLSYM